MDGLLLDAVPSRPATSDRACRVVIENQYDFHHEVIESVVRYYPLPWETFNCTISKPIIFDFALFDNQFPNHIKLSIGSPPNHLNETEFWGWKAYFESNLQGKVVPRFEPKKGNSTAMIPTKTRALFNNLISPNQYYKGPDGPADAIIDVSCGVNKRFIFYLTRDKQKHCLLHGYVPALDDNEYVRSKTCWLSPMFPSDHCFFLPLALPPVQKIMPKEKELQVCIPGGGRRKQWLMIEMFYQINYAKFNVKLKILTRITRDNAVELSTKYHLQDRVEWISETDFLKYAQVVANCDIYLPWTDPISRPSFFPTGKPGGGKSLSGSIPEIIAYKIPSVMHKELEAIYHGDWTAPVEVYDEERTYSRAAALSRMIERLAEKQ